MYRTLLIRPSRFYIASNAIYVHQKETAAVADKHRELPGSARLELVEGISLLHPEDAVLRAMLRGWEQQLLGDGGRSAPIWGL